MPPLYLFNGHQKTQTFREELADAIREGKEVYPGCSLRDVR
jgi:hypothetical protein